MTRTDVVREAGRLTNLAARSRNADLLAAAHLMVELAGRMGFEPSRLLWFHQVVERKYHGRPVGNASHR